MARLTRVTTVGLLILVVVTGATAQRQVLRAPRPLIMKPQPVLRLALTAVARSREFNEILSEHKVKAAQRSQCIQEFRSLPADLQESVLTIMSPKWAEHVVLPARELPAIRPVRIGPIMRLRMSITEFWPEEGSPDCWAYAFGILLNDNCQIYFDGNAVETHYLGWG